MEVGLREANQHFSKIMKAVRAGEEVMLTERGKPLARIVPAHLTAQAEATVRRLEAAGLLRAALKTGPMPDFKPRALRGPLMSQTLREERESS